MIPHHTCTCGLWLDGVLYVSKICPPVYDRGNTCSGYMRVCGCVVVCACVISSCVYIVCMYIHVCIVASSFFGFVPYLQIQRKRNSRHAASHHVV